MAKKAYIGVGNFIPRELPSGYMQVEYIESSGTQYIDTGIQPKYNTRIVMDISGLGSSTQWLFGARDTKASTAEKQFGVARVASGLRADYFGTNTTLSISDTTARSVVERNANVVNAFGQTVTNTAVSSGEVSYTMYLFSMNTAGALDTSMASFKMYSCQIYDNGTLVRDYVPCTNSAGTAGLYDMANGVFYQNAGTGTFAVGTSTLTSVARKIVGGYVGIDGVARKIKKAYIGIDGVAHDVSFKTPIGDFPVGTSVYLQESGKAKEYIIVHQGNPDTGTYDASCNGTWLMRKEIYGTCEYYGGDTDINIYSGYELDKMMNTTVYGKFSATLKSAIQTAKIPYIDGVGPSGSYRKLENGLARNVFALSNYEVGFRESDNEGVYRRVGSKLSYFQEGTSSSANNLRKAYQGTTASYWWLRSPCKDKNYYSDCVYTSGGPSRGLPSNTFGVRPALILKPDTNVPSDMIITGA